MAEEKLERANFYGAEKIIAGRGGAAGGSGGGGLGVTGGAYVPAEGGITTTNRWLRFDFNDPNHRSLIILGGTSFTIGENIVTIDETTSYSLTDYISEEGADYYVFINADGRVVASTVRTPADGYMFIGQFHTLCNGVAANTTAIMSVGAVSKQIGDFVDIQNYFKERDLDFYNFYHKEIRSMNNGDYYNVATVDHALAGFNTGDILPESVWCLNWHPASKKWDGMVWCNAVNICVDIYLQSGTGEETASEYGAVHTMNRQQQNFSSDMLSIGKYLADPSEFFSFSEGSNQRTTITGSMDWTTVGGHVDTANRRMISFIGCEECCGYMSQDCRIQYSIDSTTSNTVDDGRGLFGLSSEAYWDRVDVGGAYGSSNESGSRGRDTALSRNIGAYGSRGICSVLIV